VVTIEKIVEVRIVIQEKFSSPMVSNANIIKLNFEKPSHVSFGLPKTRFFPKQVL